MNILKIKREDFIRLLVEKRWIWHFAFWTAYFILETTTYFYNEHLPADAWKIVLIQNCGIILIAYVIILICFPLFYNKKKYTLFIISVIINTLIFNLLAALLSKDILNKFVSEVTSLPEITLLETFMQVTSYSMLFSVFVVMSKLGKQLFIEQYHNNEKKKMQLQSELNNLKAQLSPHFLFNTMNNFYGLAVEKSNKLPDLMLRLSSLMRYSLYETKNEFVSLESEIDFLLNYIELEKIRLENTLQLTFNFNEDKIKKYTIAPLLLIVFVENAFKHSRNSVNEPVNINIDLVIEHENNMCFKIQNKYFKHNNDSNLGGLGINNVKKRLEVLYPNNLHTLEIIKRDSNYCVNLHLSLNLITN